MVIKISSKNQVTIPKVIADEFNLKKGDVLEVKKSGNKIIMVPKEVIYTDKYPVADLEEAERVLSKEIEGEEISFDSGSAMIKHLKKRSKK